MRVKGPLCMHGNLLLAMTGIKPVVVEMATLGTSRGLDPAWGGPSLRLAGAWPAQWTQAWTWSQTGPL